MSKFKKILFYSGKVCMLISNILILNLFYKNNKLLSNVNNISDEITDIKSVECKCKKEKKDEISKELSNKSEHINSTDAYIDTSYSDIELLSKLLWLESRGESDIGQQAVAEVVVNRVNHNAFPNSIYDVIFQKGQFSNAYMIHSITATEKEYLNAKKVLMGETDILKENVVYFSTAPQNDRIYKIIGNHYFNEY